MPTTGTTDAAYHRKYRAVRSAAVRRLIARHALEFRLIWQEEARRLGVDITPRN